MSPKTQFIGLMSLSPALCTRGARKGGVGHLFEEISEPAELPG